jgi:hypothetical protein
MELLLEALFSLRSVLKPRASCHWESPETADEQEVGVRWPLACEDVSPGVEERPLLGAVTRQRSHDRDSEHSSV